MLGLAPNLGTIDRIVRVTLGVLVLVLGFGGFLPGLWEPAARIFGWFPLATGLLGWCPLYTILGVDTCRR